VGAFERLYQSVMLLVGVYTYIISDYIYYSASCLLVLWVQCLYRLSGHWSSLLGTELVVNDWESCTDCMQCCSRVRQSRIDDGSDVCGGPHPMISKSSGYCITCGVARRSHQLLLETNGECSGREDGPSYSNAGNPSSPLLSVSLSWASPQSMSAGSSSSVV